MIKVVAKNNIKEGCMDTVLNLLEEMIALTRKEDGCIKYELYQNIEDSNIITFIEEWESMEKLDAHIASEHFKRIIPEVGKYNASEESIDIYKQIK